MKSALFLAFALFSSLSLAGEKYICREIGGDQYSPKKLVLTQVGDAKIQEGRSYPFILEIFQGSSSKPLTYEPVNVRTEDVMFKFTNTARKISGIIFMDELNQSWVKIEKTEIRFDCN